MTSGHCGGGGTVSKQWMDVSSPSGLLAVLMPLLSLCQAVLYRSSSVLSREDVDFVSLMRLETEMSDSGFCHCRDL